MDPAAPWGPGAFVRDRDRTPSWAALQDDLGVPAGPRTAVLGYGSNPAPETLARKLRELPAGPVAVPVLELAVHDMDAAWSAHVHAGYVPATVVRSPGTVLRAWALLLRPEELDVVNASESLGRNYALGRLTGVDARFADGSACPELLSYVSLHGALAPSGAPLAVGPVHAERRTLEALDESGVLDLARSLTAPGSDPVTFAEALAGDPAAADRCTAGLAATALPFDWPGWVPLLPAA